MPRKPTRNQVNVAIGVEAVGGEHIAQVLRALPDAIRNEILEPMVTKLCKMGAKIAKANLKRMLPKRNPRTRRWDRPTGALYDSIGMKTVRRSRMRNKKIIIGYYGARLDFKASVRTTKRIAKSRMFRTVDPRRAHTNRIRFPAGHPRAGRINEAESGIIKPYKYIHLVNFGHREVHASRMRVDQYRTKRVAGKGRTYYIPAARPYPFLTQSHQAIQSIAAHEGPAMINALFPKVVNRVASRFERRAVRYRAGSRVR